MGRDSRAAWSALVNDRIVSIATLLALWSLAGYLAASPRLLPGPFQVIAFIWHACLTGELPRAFAATLLRVLAAFTLAMLGGGFLGYIAGRFRRINALLDPWVVIALNLPVLVVIVLAYIWIGLNDVAAVLAVIIAKMPTVIVTVREGARSLDPGFAEVATVFHLPPGRRLRLIVLPQLMPYIAAAGRSGLSITWKIVLLVELLGCPNGVGYTLNLFFQDFDVTGILAYGLAFAGLMLVVETAFLQPLEQRATSWRTHA